MSHQILFGNFFLVSQLLFCILNTRIMDVNLKENIEQLVSMFEQGIEYEVNKTMAGFESIAPPQQLNTSFRSNFFDILENR